MLPDPLFWNVHMYGIMIAVGLGLAFGVLFLYAKKKGIDPAFTDFIFYNGIFSVAFGFGSAALFQATYDYIQNPERGFRFGGGITFLGGLIGGTAFFLIVYFLLRKRYKTGLMTALPIIPCMITVAHAFGRVGCFFAGCCHGKATDSFLGVQFPGLSEPVHPTQLYEAAFLFLLFGVCSFLYLKKNFTQTMPLYLICYGVFRFLLEFLRGDNRGELLGFLTPSQFWSLLMVIGGIVLWILPKYLKKPQTEEESPTVEQAEEQEKAQDETNA